MKNIIKSIIETVQEYKDSDAAFNFADIAKDLIDEMASTMNCPSNWQDIGKELAGATTG